MVLLLSRMIRIEKNVTFGVLLGVGDGVDSRYRDSWYVFDFEMVSSRDVIESVQSVDSR